MDNLSDFVDSLQELMLEKGVKPIEIHNATKISLSVIYDWFKKKRIPNLNSLIAVSNYFECSIDYLCGRTEHNFFRKSNNLSTFSKRFRLLIEKKKVTRRKLSAEVNLSMGCIQRFLADTGKPLFYSLIRLADYFECSIDYLVGLSDYI
ncbi:MAG: transcriptional regulator [Firmicutes bacterium]|nr:transcriptional regulator [Bacillota bacterium]